MYRLRGKAAAAASVHKITHTPIDIGFRAIFATNAVWTERFCPWSEWLRPWTEAFGPWIIWLRPWTDGKGGRSIWFRPWTEALRSWRIWFRPTGKRCVRGLIGSVRGLFCSVHGRRAVLVGQFHCVRGRKLRRAGLAVESLTGRVRRGGRRSTIRGSTVGVRAVTKKILAFYENLV